MSYLTLSEFPDVNRYRADGTLRDEDLVEVSLYRGGVTPTSVGRYVSAKVPLLDLKTYLNANIETQTQSIADFQLFDICQRLTTSPPILAQIFSDNIFMGNIYSHWPLFIDESGISPDWNSTAPNWIGQNHIQGFHKNIEEMYPDFWSVLSANWSNNCIKYDIVNTTSADTIISSNYMTEFNSLGYTSRFLIDPINKFVAAPILNSSFMGCPSLSAQIFTSVSDSIPSHTHATVFNIQSAVSTSSRNCTFEIDSTTSISTLKTAPTDISQDPSSQFAETTHPKYIDIAPFLCIANNLDETAMSGIYIPEVYDDVPIGTILTFATSTPPSGWIVCDGRTLPASQYPNLANALQVFESSATFSIPNMIDCFSTQDLSGDEEFITDNGSNILDHHHGIGNGVNFISRAWNTPTQIKVGYHDLYSDGTTSGTLSAGSVHTIYPQYETSTQRVVLTNMINYCVLLPCIKATNV